MTSSGSLASDPRADEIRRTWELTTETGVVVRPTHARVQAAANEGLDVSGVEPLLAAGERAFAAGEWGELLVVVARICQVLRQARAAGFSRQPSLPDTLEAIWASLPVAPRLPVFGAPPLPAELSATYREHVLGGWRGKVIGGALGSPVEGWTSQRIAERYGEVTAYLAAPTTLNDDTAYEILLLHAVEEYGPAFTSTDLGLEWVAHLPRAYTAEEIALANLRAGVMPPESGRRDNPFGHWIGAMMKGEICGWLAPGRPDVAVGLAHRDAVIAHHTEGVYGALFNAATIAAAFVERDPRRLIEIGLAFVPPASDFAAVARTALGWCASAGDWRAAWANAERELVDRYHWIHAFPNLAAVIVALWFGAGDFGKTIAIATMCGQDTDCTAGQAGALVGTALGETAIPGEWRGPIGDRLDSYVVGFESLAFDELAVRTCAAGDRVLANYAGGAHHAVVGGGR
jgi:ADP-ribosylglycohydrolase